MNLLRWLLGWRRERKPAPTADQATVWVGDLANMSPAERAAIERAAEVLREWAGWRVEGQS